MVYNFPKRASKFSYKLQPSEIDVPLVFDDTD